MSMSMCTKAVGVKEICSESEEEEEDEISQLTAARSKRAHANRQSAQRSKLRKQQHTWDLENHVRGLQAQISEMQSRVHCLRKAHSGTSNICHNCS